ncbi:uncharacterized protein LOC115776897 [Archocentrus centrarchus]|uniref:uncharacterized protein LOC115776897 n=1 Tax=Archocentrus centrarchus TaxID=63155 RepID=UPI0011E9FC99|nr:uncharacterized protein LOC115776897 [Archocentrus centrarchus]XP_030580568.1 uncharacterized protein LOC115776897 [Archocentrus centrarchus]
MRKALLLDIKKSNNRELVKLKMEKTYAYRRHEIVRDAPMVEAFMARWPALFDIREINAEFKRITNIPLQSKSLSQLDLHLGNLVKLFKRRGGQLGQKLAQMDDCEDVDAGRECVIKGVCVYMGEDPDHLIREYVGMDEAAISEAIEDTTVGTYLLKEEASADEQEIGVVLEGIRVMTNLDNIAFAVVMLFGLIYALNLAYPADLRYTFEVFQKILMELDGGKLSNKVLALKNRLFE